MTLLQLSDFSFCMIIYIAVSRFPFVVIHGCDIRYITVKEYQNFRKVTDYKREQYNGDLILQRYSMNFLKQISRQYFRFRANSKWLHEYM